MGPASPPMAIAGSLGIGVVMRATYLFLQLIRTEFPSVYLLRRV
jgi:hypothetical protein